MTMPSVVSLPQELKDRIIDYLHDDLPTLHSCALAHRLLLSSCRTHLLRELSVNMDDRGHLKRLADALEHEAELTSYVHELHWSGSWDYPTAWAIAPFSGFTALTALYLTHMQFGSFDELVGYVLSFPSLITLGLHSVRCERFSACKGRSRTKPQLQHLYLEDVDRRMAEPLQSWLQASPTRESLRLLSVEWMRDRDVHLTQGFLGWHVETLDELHIPIRVISNHSSIVDAFPLISTHAITTLSLSIQFVDFASVASIAMELLSTLRIPSVQIVRLEVRCRNRYDSRSVTLPGVDLSERAPTFSREQFPCLQRIEVEFLHVVQVHHAHVLTDCFRTVKRRDISFAVLPQGVVKDNCA